MKTKKTICLFVAACLAMSLIGCGKTEKPIETAPATTPELVSTPAPTTEPAAEMPAATEKPAPTAKSGDVGFYVAKDLNGNAYVVNAFGQRATGYSVDADGNICDMTGEPIVMAANSEEFRFITELQFGARNYNAKLTAKKDETKSDASDPVVKQQPVSFYVVLSILPANPANGVVIISSSNDDVAEIRANSNAKILAAGDYNLDDGEIAIQFPADTNSVSLLITAKTAGEAKVTAKALTGGASTKCTVKVVNGELAPEESAAPETTPAPGSEPDLINASGDPTMHIHEYTSEVVNPTETEKGYTVHTCACGHSYIDNWTAPLMPEQPEPAAHVHSYSAVTVSPTATEQGYTLHVCECGDSYKDSFVDPIS